MDSTSGDGPVRTGFEPSNFLRSFVQTARAVILEPAGFFRGLDPQRSSGGAVLFAVVCVVIGLLLTYAVAPVESWIWRDPPPRADRASWIILALSPLFAWIGLYLLAIFQHLFVMIFVRPRRDFDATLRVSAYASALALLSWVPVVGYLASAYGLYVTVLGIRELHETSTARALLAVLVPSLVFLADIVWTFWP